MSKTILANVDGFTPCMDVIVDKYGIVTAAIFGVVWRFCQMKDGVCAICSQKESSKNNYLCVDHDHKTGKVRGLLCTQCNHAIGKLKDDPNLFIKAAEYLADHTPTPGF